MHASAPSSHTSLHYAAYKLFTLVALISITALCLVSLTGCGSSENSSQDTSSDSYTLVQEGTLTVAASLDFPPFESYDGSAPTGFAVELMEALATKMGLECTYLPSVKFDSIVPMIAAGGKADVGVSSFTINPERAKEIDFTNPYIDSNQGVVVQTKSGITSVEALQGKTIGAQSGTTGYDWAVENIIGARVVAYDEMTAVFAALESGQVDGLVADLPVVQNYTKTAYTNDSVIAQIPTGEQYGMAVNKNNPALTAALNTALQEAIDDGTYAEIYQKYFD